MSATSLLHSYVFDVERRVVSDGDLTFERDVVTHRGAVAMLAVDDNGRVGVLRQYRATVDGELWEIPAGTIDSGEGDPLEVAKRELREELGCEAETWSLLGRFYNSPGWTNQQMFVYLAANLMYVERQPIGPEEIRSTIHWLDKSQVSQMLESNEPIDSTTALALQWLVWRDDD